MKGALLALLLLARPAAAGPWERLRDAATRVRLGQAEGLDDELGRLRAADVETVRAAASLLQARRRLESGDLEGAAEALAGADLVRRTVEPAWRWVEVDLLEARGEHRLAFARLEALRRGWPRYRRHRAEHRRARLAADALPPAEAAALQLELVGTSPLHLPDDELLARAARLLSGSDPERAAALWRRVWVEHPESPLAGEAAPHAGPPSDEVALERARRLFQRRSYERCREVAIPLWEKGYERERVGFWLGKIASERLRDDHEAAARYLAVAAAPGAPFAKGAQSSYAIVLGKLGRTEEALSAFDLWLERYPRASPRDLAEVHYDRGRALRTGGRPLQASRELGRFLARHRRGFDRSRYQWFVAFWAWLGGDPRRALEAARPLLGSKGRLVGDKARYWRARWLDALGRRREAVTELAGLVRATPLTYYSGLAGRLLFRWGQAARLPPRPTWPLPREEIADPFAGLSADPGLASLRLAVHLADPDAAREVLREVRPRLRKRLGRSRYARLRAGLSGPLERHSGPRRAALALSRGALRRAPARETLNLWRAAYPRAFPGLVVASTARAGVPEWLVYAHMLQESGFRPWVVSPAPAYGLMELLDRTALRLAAEAGDPYQRWMLMVPRPNVRWGAQYLGALVRKFHGQLPFAVAAYNGGPLLLARHLRASRGLAFDELIEDIGPHQCRDYARLVIGHLLRYLALYESPERAEELTARLLPDEWVADMLPDPAY